MARDMNRLFWRPDFSGIGVMPLATVHLATHDSAGLRAFQLPDHWYMYALYTDRVQPPLYVGCTGAIITRIKQHRTGRAWWPLVDRIVVDRFDNRDDAMEREDRAIWNLKPLFNIAGNCHIDRQLEGA